MSGRWTLFGLLVVLALLTLAGPAMAGGYAVVRLDEEPGEVLAGVPWQFGFMVLQHDVTPNSDVTPIVRAQNRATGEEISTTAVQEGPVGHFVAELALPRAGEWKWSIEPQPYTETSFPTLTVLASPAVRVWPPSLAWILFDGSATNSGVQTAVVNEPAGTQAVEILDPWAFAPFSVEIEAGAAVTWINHSAATHMVTGDDLAFDDSGPIRAGESFTATFDEPGTYRYRCGPHPGMVGEIVVS